MLTKKSFDTGMILFYEFEPGERFVGRFTGRYKQVGNDSHPIFVDEDSTEWLLNNHSMIKKICTDLAPETLVEIIYKGQVTIKSSNRKFSNYTVSYFTDEKEGETQKDSGKTKGEQTEKETEPEAPIEAEPEAPIEAEQKAFGKGRKAR